MKSVAIRAGAVAAMGLMLASVLATSAVAAPKGGGGHDGGHGGHGHGGSHWRAGGHGHGHGHWRGGYGAIAAGGDGTRAASRWVSASVRR